MIIHMKVEISFLGVGNQATGWSTVRVRVVVMHWHTGQVLVVRPFVVSSSVSVPSPPAATTDGGWGWPETHQDVRGGETAFFSAQRVMVSAFGLKIELVGMILVKLLLLFLNSSLFMYFLQQFMFEFVGVFFLAISAKIVELSLVANCNLLLCSYLATAGT
jgi:hypothetical protein